MLSGSPSGQPPAEIDKISARRFPLVHKLIHFADLRHFNRDLREALISANRRAGAQQGLVTKEPLHQQQRADAVEFFGEATDER